MSLDVRLCNDLSRHACERAMESIKTALSVIPDEDERVLAFYMTIFRFKLAFEVLQEDDPDFKLFTDSAQTTIN